MQCIVVTPEATVLSVETTFVALPLYDGELGVASNHSPMIGRLGYGELRVESAGTKHRFYVDGGFVQVADNVIAVLTNRAVPAAQVDTDTATAQLADALQRRPAGEEELAIRDRLVRQARAQLRVARRPA